MPEPPEPSPQPPPPGATAASPSPPRSPIAPFDGKDDGHSTSAAVCHDVANIYTDETAAAKSFCSTFDTIGACLLHCVNFCSRSDDPLCDGVETGQTGLGDTYGDDNFAGGLGNLPDGFRSGPDGFGRDFDDYDDLDPDLPGGDPSKKKPSGMGVGLPLLLLAFFGCFFYQTYQKHQRRRRQGPDDSEGISLMDCVRPAARAMSNRTSDMIDRRREQSRGGLARNEGGGGRWNGRDEDEDGML